MPNRTANPTDLGSADAAKLDRLSRSHLDYPTLMERARQEEWALVILDLGVRNRWESIRPLQSRSAAMPVRTLPASIGETFGADDWV